MVGAGQLAVDAHSTAILILGAVYFQVFLPPRQESANVECYPGYCITRSKAIFGRQFIKSTHFEAADGTIYTVLT